MLITWLNLYDPILHSLMHETDESYPLSHTALFDYLSFLDSLQITE